MTRWLANGPCDFFMEIKHVVNIQGKISITFERTRYLKEPDVIMYHAKTFCATSLPVRPLDWKPLLSCCYTFPSCYSVCSGCKLQIIIKLVMQRRVEHVRGVHHQCESSKDCLKVQLTMSWNIEWFYFLLPFVDRYCILCIIMSSLQLRVHRVSQSQTII